MSKEQAMLFYTVNCQQPGYPVRYVSVDLERVKTLRGPFADPGEASQAFQSSQQGTGQTCCLLDDVSFQHKARALARLRRRRKDAETEQEPHPLTHPLCERLTTLLEALACYERTLTRTQSQEAILLMRAIEGWLAEEPSLAEEHPALFGRAQAQCEELLLLAIAFAPSACQQTLPVLRQRRHLVAELRRFARTLQQVPGWTDAPVESDPS